MREWDVLRRGLTQRLRALNCFLADIYGEGRILADGVVPVDLVRGCPQYRTEMRAVEAPFGTYISMCGTDIVRTHDGFMVLEDVNVQSCRGGGGVMGLRWRSCRGLATILVMCYRLVHGDRRRGYWHGRGAGRGARWAVVDP